MVVAVRKSRVFATEKNKREIFFIYFFRLKMQFTYSQASLKDAQGTGEAFSPQKKTSSNSKNETY